MRSLGGTMWKLVQASETSEEGSELASPLGVHPMGFAVFETQRMMVAVCGDQSARSADATRGILVAYAGKYRFDGTYLVTTPDTASDPGLLTEQIRHLRFDNSGRMTATPVTPLLGRVGSLTLVWERV